MVNVVTNIVRRHYRGREVRDEKRGGERTSTGMIGGHRRSRRRSNELTFANIDEFERVGRCPTSYRTPLVYTATGMFTESKLITMRLPDPKFSPSTLLLASESFKMAEASEAAIATS